MRIVRSEGPPIERYQTCRQCGATSTPSDTTFKAIKQAVKEGFKAYALPKEGDLTPSYVLCKQCRSHIKVEDIPDLVSKEELQTWEDYRSYFRPSSDD